MDALGAPRVLRSVRDAVDRPIFQGAGLRRWCFDRSGDRDAGLFVAARLTRPPHIDGDGGLFAAAERERAVEAKVDGQVVYALGLAAIEGSWVHCLGRAAAATGSSVTVTVDILDDDGERTETVGVRRFVFDAEVRDSEADILQKLDSSVSDGAALLRRAPDMFPRIRFGQRAEEQITALYGSEQVFRQLLRHLRALDQGAANWPDGTPFAPFGGVTWSVESGSTLGHARYGPMRDFPVPAGFPVERWTLHTKLTGERATRMYFRPERIDGGAVVLIGYFGPKLPTVSFQTCLLIGICGWARDAPCVTSCR